MIKTSRIVYLIFLIKLTISQIHHRRSDITLNTEKLNQLGSQGQLLLRHIALTTHSCGIAEVPRFRRKFLKHSSATCNDGSPSGYYIRKSHGSSKWIVFLEGGWYCFDQISCSERLRMMNDYMSSRSWPRHRKGSGILSWNPEDNPYYFRANMVIIPYCSSDSWSGTRNSSSKSRDTVSEFSFMGSLILEEVIKELLKKGLRNAKKMLLVGSSAGGTGVLINLDRVADQVRKRAPKVEVRGVVDAGWFLDNEPFKPSPCRDAYTCSPTVGISKGVEVWKPRLPEECVQKYPTEIWRCYFGHRVYPSIKTPVYIIQNLYDAAQIKVDNVFSGFGRSEMGSDQWSYLLRLGEEVKLSLKNASAVFASACVSHDILLKSEWHKMEISGENLAKSVYCWEESNYGDRDRRESRSSCKHQLLDSCPWPHCNCSCPKWRFHGTNEINQYFMKNLAKVMGIEPSKMENIHLCGY
ncbi:hypothetical protein LOTGIDRAFT_106761 [Lottia gigantea]|uniref:Uncharacterized protein n=1 Tax=Lottia gigantea TaxID=225164 RepID=V3ZCW8_LOTGI|nr:hypothetical protein LOTGIDRAFT_106761 [Lottia gigantea]ESO88928.1 hypothetical protein LOTGIDRAFT_106761 [Lottia gigantea]